MALVPAGSAASTCTANVPALVTSLSAPRSTFSPAVPSTGASPALVEGSPTTITCLWFPFVASVRVSIAVPEPAVIATLESAIITALLSYTNHYFVIHLSYVLNSDKQHKPLHHFLYQMRSLDSK